MNQGGFIVSREEWDKITTEQTKNCPFRKAAKEATKTGSTGSPDELQKLLKGLK